MPLTMLIDLVVLVATVNIFTIDSTVDVLHKLIYCIAGINLGWYLNLRYRQIKYNLRERSKN